MSAVIPLRCLMGSAAPKLSKYETILLEVELFARICDELKAFFMGSKIICLDIYRTAGEGVAMEVRLVKSIINDILSTGEYNLQGIACYTGTHEDIVEDIFTGMNNSPTAVFFRRLVDLHRTVRRELYEMIMQKITPPGTEPN